VRIDGSLLPGGRVRADGNLHILGNVASAVATVSGNIRVDGVVSGTATVLDAIRCIAVWQVEDALLMAGRDIVVLTAAERCRLQAGGEILLTGSPGLLRGGVAQAGTGITASRIEAGAGKPAVLEIGGQVFPEDLAELEERLAFTRQQTMRAKLQGGGSPETYRRGLAGLRAYRKLARKLGHRARQMRMAMDRGTPSLKVTGDAPVSAVLHFGPDGRAVETPPHGPFELAGPEDGARVPSSREVVREQ
jgi:hypothetical protein